MAKFVTCVNRSSKPLNLCWNGVHSVLSPGKHSLPEYLANAAQRQNPIMGSDDPITGNLEYLVGIEENGDDCSPIEQSDEIELFNRGKMKNAVPVMIVAPRSGLYAQERHSTIASAPGGAVETFFDKP